jgi:transcriptional regulator with XRE-family HTH domain
MNKMSKHSEENLKLMAALIGDIIAERERQGISQSKLAEMAGIKQSAISRMESLKALPQLDTLLKVLQPIGLTLALRQPGTGIESGAAYNFDGVREIRGDLLFCHLEVSMSPDDEIRFITEEESQFFIERIDDALSIKQKKRNVLKWLIDWTPINAELRLPKSFKGDLLIKNRDGKTQMFGIRAADIDIRNRNGNISCERVEAGEFTAEDANGRIDLRDVKAVNFNISNANGRIVLNGAEAREEISARSSNGKVRIDSGKAPRVRIKSSNGRIDMENITADRLTAFTDNGKIVCGMNGKQSEYAFNIITQNGSATVGDGKFMGRYTVKDKDKKKNIEAQSKNGNIRFTFSDTVTVYKEDADDPYDPARPDDPAPADDGM